MRFHESRTEEKKPTSGNNGISWKEYFSKSLLSAVIRKLDILREYLELLQFRKTFPLCWVGGGCYSQSDFGIFLSSRTMTILFRPRRFRMKTVLRAAHYLLQENSRNWRNFTSANEQYYATCGRAQLQNLRGVGGGHNQNSHYPRKHVKQSHYWRLLANS